MAKILKWIPSGISSFDAIIGGGFPSGSLILLSGEEGSGNVEFTYTSTVTLAAMKKSRTAPPSARGGVLPEQICYISFSRSKSDIIDEITRSFTSEFHELFEKDVNFKDLSPEYFANLRVPSEWTHKMGTTKKTKKGEIRTSLVNILNKNAKNSVVILHSLNDLARLYGDDQKWLISFLLGLRRMAKIWNGLIYAIFTPGALDSKIETEIKSCFDGILKFGWMKVGTVKRQRSMYFEKFGGLLPHIEERLGSFTIEITNRAGLVISQVAMLQRLR